MSSHALKTDEMSEASARMLRDFRAILGEIAKPLTENPPRPPTGRVGKSAHDLASQLETLVGLVETSRKVIDSLVITLREHEGEAYDLKCMLSEAAAQKEGAYQHSAKVETAIRAEKERADIAEARAISAEEDVHLMRNREAIIQKNLAGLIAGVGHLASATQIETDVLALELTAPMSACDRAA